jgi:hypothetical protein
MSAGLAYAATEEGCSEISPKTGTKHTEAQNPQLLGLNFRDKFTYE